MGNLNKVLLMGNLTRDPELRYTSSGLAVAKFGMAINRTWNTPDGQKREETCFVDVSMFGRRGEVVCEYFSKGKPIFIEGRLNFSTWQGQDGQKRSKLEVVADSFEFVGGPMGQSGQQSRAPQQQSQYQGQPPAPPAYGPPQAPRQEPPPPPPPSYEPQQPAPPAQGPPPAPIAEPEPLSDEGLDVDDDKIPF